MTFSGSAFVRRRPPPLQMHLEDRVQQCQHGRGDQVVAVDEDAEHPAEHPALREVLVEPVVGHVQDAQDALVGGCGHRERQGRRGWFEAVTLWVKAAARSFQLLWDSML